MSPVLHVKLNFHAHLTKTTKATAKRLWAKVFLNSNGRAYLGDRPIRGGFTAD
jgi:hypothetical protein